MNFTANNAHFQLAILLNGIPVILGATFLQITIFNFIAIAFEYHFLARRWQINQLLLRVIIANVSSLCIGLLVMFTVSNYMPGNIWALGMGPHFTVTPKDKCTLIFSLLIFIIINTAIEIPAYLIRNNESNKRKLIKHIVVANIISNIPVVGMYLLIGF